MAYTGLSSIPSASPSPTVSPQNLVNTQLLANPNTYGVQQKEQANRLGMGYGGLMIPGQSSANWPHAGMGTGVGALSQNPLQQSNQAAMIAALQGQR